MTASRPLEPGARAAAWLAASGADVPALVVRAAGTAAAAAAAGCGLVIATRRLSGAIEPAAPALLLGAAAAGIPLVIAADVGRRAGGPLAGPLAARCGLVLAVAALALPPRAADTTGWILVAATLAVVATAVAWLPGRGTPRPRAAAASGRARGGSPHRAVRPRREPQPGLLRQRFERRELPAGGERVRGRVVVVVPAGAKAGYGHLGFCPAFAAPPGVEVTTAYDGVEATLLAAEVLPWGVRVECRLAEAAEEQLEIPVDLVAVAADAS